MADITQVNIIPSQPVQSVQQATQGNTSHAAPVITNLPVGTILKGFVVNRNPAGNPILRTDSGDVVFTSNFFLKIGSEVVVRIENTAGNTLAHILSVDGQSPQVAEGQSAFANEPSVIISPHFTPPQISAELNAAAPLNVASIISEEPAITLTGTLISQPPATTPATEPALPTGSQLTLRIVTLNVAATPNTSETSISLAPQASVSSQANTASYAVYAKASGTSPATPPVVTSPVTISQSSTALPQTQPTSSNAQAVPQIQPVITNAQAAPGQPLVTSSVNVTQVQQAVPATPSIQTTTPASPNIVSTSIASAVSQTVAATQLPVSSNISVSQIETPVPPIVAAPETANVAIVTVPSQPAAATVAQVAAPTFVTETTPQVTPQVQLPPVTPQPGQIVTATVIGNEPTGEALVQTSIGVIRLQPGSVVPPGSTITFEVIQTMPASTLTASAGLASIPPAPITELAQQWTTLQQIFTLLAGRSTLTGLDAGISAYAGVSATAGGATAPTSISPQAISTGLMLFMSALRGGNFRNWLGDNNVKWLEDTGHDSLVKKAEGEFQGLSRQFNEVRPQHWQALFFPVAVEGNLHQVRMFVKRDKKEQSKNPNAKREEDTRFVIEVDLTQLGELQMDGFVRRRDKELQFDMMIRTLTPLPQDVQQDILMIYNSTGAITGYKGSISFQAVEEFPVTPMEDIVAGNNTVVA